MSNVNLKQCDRCGTMLDAYSAFCGNCGKQFNISGESSLTPPPGELQQRPITPSFSNPGLYTPAQSGYGSSPAQPGYGSPPPPKRSGSNKIYLVMIAILVLMLLGTFIFFLGKESSQVSTGTSPGTANQSATKPANNNATSTVATASPTVSTTTPTDLTGTPDLTATSAGLTLAPAETLPESITLKCDCTDPVVVTITKIVVEPPQNRMIWSLTFFNNTQSGTFARFNQLSLQKGDQVHYPTTGEQTYDATGGGTGVDDVSLQAGQTKQVTLTFSFVPYKGIPYTLVSQLVGGFDTVTFNPEVIQF